MGNPFTAPNLGDDNGGGVMDAFKKQFVQRSTGAQPQDPTLDVLSPEAVADRQRSAAQMRDGINSAFGTRDAAGNISLRGTDTQNQATTGAETAAANKPPPPPRDKPIIPKPDDADAPFQDPTNESQQQANDRYENNKRYRQRTGKAPDDSLIPGGN